MTAANGDLYIADAYFRIRKVAVSGIITTVAGNGVMGSTGDGGPIGSATIAAVSDLAIDVNGNIYLAQSYFSLAGNSDCKIRKITAATQTITTVAGSSAAGFSGDGGPATSASLKPPQGVSVDGSGNIFIADTENQRIRKVNISDGTITTIAGVGYADRGFAGDNGQAVNALFSNIGDVAVDASGNVYVTDVNNQRIRKITASTGIISMISGNGTAASTGDNGPAANASLYNPTALVIDANGNIYFWNTALTNTQVQNNMSVNLTPQTGLVGYYDMKDGGAMQSLNDLSTTVLADKNNGTLGSTTGVDTSDPAWLTASQLTCTVSGNFRERVLENYTEPDSTQSEDIAGLTVYPNPADGELHINLFGSSEELISATLFDALGKSVTHSVINTGKHEILIDTKELKQGVYIVHIFSSEGLLARQKIIILH